MDEPALATSEYVFALFKALGGVALFLYGMEQLAEGLQKAAGQQLRIILQRLTSRQSFGFLGGTFLSTLIHSGATTIMVIGFINAGLITFAQSIGVVLGANVGTTLSMQFFSLDLGLYCYFGMAVGFWVRMFGRSEFTRHFGASLFGLGVLFLGLVVMKGAMEPLKHSPALVAALSHIDAHSASGVIIGILFSTILTALLQSSGATIAVLFSLVSAGVITDLSQTFPVILGSHIGTCVTTLIGAVGTSVFAKRSAVAHLVFNILSTILAIATMPLYFKYMPYTSDSLVRQVANVNTLTQLVAALALLPFCASFATLINRMTPSRHAVASVTYLDPHLVATPEMAILAATKELRRQAAIVRRMLETSLDALVTLDLSRFNAVLKDEEAVNAVKKQFDQYVVLVAERQISKRQSVMLQHLISSSNDIERIGDHIKTLTVLTKTKVRRRIWFDDENMVSLLAVGNVVAEAVSLAVDSLDPTHDEYRSLASQVLERRRKYKQMAGQIKQRFNGIDFDGADEAVAGMYYMRYITVFDRIIRHLKAIAREELAPDYLVKEYKLSMVAPVAAEPTGPPPEHRRSTSYKEFALPKITPDDAPAVQERRDAPLFVADDAED